METATVSETTRNLSKRATSPTAIQPTTPTATTATQARTLEPMRDATARTTIATLPSTKTPLILPLGTKTPTRTPTATRAARLRRAINPLGT